MPGLLLAKLPPWLVALHCFGFVIVPLCAVHAASGLWAGDSAHSIHIRTAEGTLRIACPRSMRRGKEVPISVSISPDSSKLLAPEVHVSSKSASLRSDEPHPVLGGYQWRLTPTKQETITVTIEFAQDLLSGDSARTAGLTRLGVRMRERAVDIRVAVRGSLGLTAGQSGLALIAGFAVAGLWSIGLQRLYANVSVGCSG